MGKFRNLINQKYGSLTVVEQLEPHFTSGGNKKYRWRCVCDCGRDANVICYTTDLTLGKRHRCTYCVRDDAAKRMRDRNKKYNEYDLSGGYGIGYTTKGEPFYFDLEDYEKIKDYCWYKHHKYYVAKVDDKIVALHKVIMDDVENNYDIDHIKTENKFDNRKLNLRKVNRSQNNCNKILQSNNTSGVAGVKWHKGRGLWEVFININKKYTYIGAYKNYDDAVKVRKNAENKYYGEYSYDNSQKLYEINGGNE